MNSFFCVEPGCWRVNSRSGEYEVNRWEGYPGGYEEFSPDNRKEVLWLITYPGSPEGSQDDHAYTLREAKRMIAQREASRQPHQ